MQIYNHLYINNYRFYYTLLVQCDLSFFLTTIHDDNHNDNYYQSIAFYNQTNLILTMVSIQIMTKKVVNLERFKISIAMFLSGKIAVAVVVVVLIEVVRVGLGIRGINTTVR